ncbi:MAG: TrkH family potassium uptake protein [Pelagibacterium sp.]|uniref:TrkH family potassium uptake protein n=1 Tax=Pelagibacterium sp. TaxID=1967288 RepID=UPI0032EE1865
MLGATAYVTAFFTLVLAGMMLVPMLVDLSVGNPDWQAFLFSALAAGVPSGFMVLATRREMPPFSLKFGFLLVNMIWAATSIVAALPLFLSGLSIGFTDAVFEATSGITTTGSTILSGLDDMPPGLLLWRSMTQWFGGLGIIAMGLLLLPFLRVGGMQIYKLESSAQADSPFARFTKFSWAMVGLYLALSIACAMAYWFAGMSSFDAINHAMTTVSTGGYSTHDASMGHFGPPVLIVGIVFMIAGALPFIAILRAVTTGRISAAFEAQVPVLLSILAVLSFAVFLSGLVHMTTDPGELAVHSAFNIVSVVTTTGFASTDYTLWGPFVSVVFLLATFLGGAAGSTSGGIKTYRLIIIYQSLRNGLKELIYPHGIFVVRYEGREVPWQAIKSVHHFIGAFLVLLLGVTLVLGFTGLDVLTAFTGALTALTNVGPGLGDIIGPAGNFSSLEPLAKWALIFAMLAGRLEILAILVLFSPAFWRR